MRLPRRPPAALRALPVVLVLLLAVPGTPRPGSAQTTSAAAVQTAAVPAAGGLAVAGTAVPAARVTKVLTVVLENHGPAAVARDMPGLTRLGRSYGRATSYRALTHPSLPNYLALAGGSTAGVRDDAGPARHRLGGASVFDVALGAGRTARTYAEGMAHACDPAATGRYAVKHNPWAYYADPGPRRSCLRDDVPSGSPSAGRLHDDVVRGTLPTVGLLVPDLCHDGHDCSLATADRWLSSWTTALMRGPDWRAGRLAVVVTFDEDEGRGDDTVVTVVATPSLSGRVATSRLTHLSWTRWMTDLAGRPPLRDAARAPSLGRAFGL